jgi:hypothetical protein
MVREHRISFTWRSWSDAIVSTEHDAFVNAITAVAKAVGALLNLFTFAAAAAVLAGIRRPRIEMSGTPCRRVDASEE